jgi:hypothetical protein
LEDCRLSQPSLFDDNDDENKIKKIYTLMEQKKIDFGSRLYEKRAFHNSKTKNNFKLPVVLFD